MKRIQELKLALYLPENREGGELDSVMYHAEDKSNHCELQADGGCVATFGIYFGTSDSHEPTFCPVHYFTGGGYTIEPITSQK